VPTAAFILDSLTTAVAMVTADGYVCHLNAAAESLLGISSNQARDRHLPTLLPELAPLGVLIERSCASGQTYGHEFDMRPVYQQGEIIKVTGRATPVRSERGLFVILELIDATHWRHIDREKALINQHDASRRVIYQLAHEIRNPLGGLRGAAQLLERQLATGELREYTRIIIGEADRLAALTDTMLGPARSPRREQENVHEILERVRALVGNEAPANVRIGRDYDPSLPPVLVDRDQLLQAVLNIARNAVQAVSQDPDRTSHVTVRTRALTNWVIGDRRHRVVANIEIEDDGPGVAPELGDSIFYPLVSGRAEGTGLGLALAQEILSRHGGLIEYRSRPGQTVFMLRLPIDTESAGDPA
jgi:two-component system nitrogen regulation sensor histidine kinase GlnL